MDGLIKRVCNAVTTAAVILVVILAILLAGIRFIGLEPFVVLSGSMEPEYHVGAMIYTRKVDPDDLQVGDPVTFMLNSTTVATHRIIEIIEDQDDPTVRRFRTKGDANQEADGKSVHENNVIGKPVFSIPYLGYVANYIQQPPGQYVALVAGVLLVIVSFLPDFLKAGKGKQQEETTDNQEVIQ